MIDEQAKTQTTLMQDVAAFHVMGEKCYRAESKESSEQYTSHLFSALMGECVAMDECDFEDGYRYTVETAPETRVDTPVESENATIAVPEVEAPARNTSVKTQTVRAFNRKRIPWLVAYVVITLAAVLVLALTLPGTSWESKVGIKAPEIMPAQPALAESTESTINTICLPDGTTQVVELTPYESTQQQSNWFDEVCDWISHVIGG